MDRKSWLKEKRYMAEKRYDTIFSINYDENWGRINEVHKRNLVEFLNMLPKGCQVLDAACGTGKYWDIILSNGNSVLGIDQSMEMLKQGKEKYPKGEIAKIGLQEMNYDNEFEGIICMDAMENVFPEEWVLVLRNFYKALKEKGYLYFTVELIDDDEMKEAYSKGKEMGLPVEEGEIAHEGGYHYYPSLEKVREWLGKVNLKIIKEDLSDGYYHFMVRR